MVLSYLPYNQSQQSLYPWLTCGLNLIPQGVRNIKIGVNPHRYLSESETVHLSSSQRRKHIAIGVLLCPPVINLVTYVALRSFADVKNWEDFSAPEEIETDKDIQASSGFVLEVERSASISDPLLSNNIQLLTQEFLQAKKARKTCAKGQYYYTYHFEILMNTQGEMVKIKEASFEKETVLEKDEISNALYTIHFTVHFAAKTSADKLFGYAFVPQAVPIPPTLTEMMENLMVELNKTIGKVQEALADKETGSKQAEWLARQIQLDPSYFSAFEDHILKEGIWDIVLHHYAVFAE